MASAVTPGDVGPPLLPVNLGMHGPFTKEMFSWTWPPGAHLLLSPAVGRPRASTCWPALTAPPAPGAAPRWVEAAPVAVPVPLRVAPPVAPEAAGWPAAAGPLPTAVA